MILLTAATPWESRPLARGLGLTREDGGIFRDGDLLLLETGMGPRAAGAALQRLDGSGPFSLALSTGFAGGLQPELAPGNLLFDPHELPPELESRAREIAVKAAIPFHCGRILSVDAPLAGPGAKRRLGERTRGAGVDMESEAVREWARGRGASFAALRAVFDAVDDRLPEAVPDSPGAADMLRFILSQWRQFPHLLRLSRIRNRGIRNLVRFLREFTTTAPLHG